MDWGQALGRFWVLLDDIGCRWVTSGIDGERWKMGTKDGPQVTICDPRDRFIWQRVTKNSNRERP